MRRIAAFGFLLLALSVFSPSALPMAAEVDGLCFVPGPQDCAAVVIDEIDRATVSVMVQAYSFTHDGIAKALVRAKGRGLDVRVVLDKSNVCAGAEGPEDEEAQACRRKGSRIAELLTQGGVGVRIDRRHAIAHSKVMILDGRRVLTGSFNWSVAAATKNSENLVILADFDVGRIYTGEWIEHWGHSEPYGQTGRK